MVLAITAGLEAATDTQHVFPYPPLAPFLV